MSISDLNERLEIIKSAVEERDAANKALREEFESKNVEICKRRLQCEDELDQLRIAFLISKRAILAKYDRTINVTEPAESP